MKWRDAFSDDPFVAFRVRVAIIGVWCVALLSIALYFRWTR